MKKILVLLCFTLSLYGLSWASNYGQSIEGESATVTFSHTATCDSGRVWFGYPDTTNWYASYKLTVAGWDNNDILSFSVSLDSIGTHVVRISYWETGAGSVSGYVSGIWLHNDDAVGSSGLRAVNIYVKNSADSAALQSVTVSIDDSSSQAFIGTQATNPDGLTTWGLDDDTYEITFSAAGWSITSPVYLTVTADDDTTYYATQYSPTPPSATYCVVYTHTYKLTGAYSGCRLEARIPVEYGVVTSSTFLAVPYVVADTSEADGKVELGLIRSTNLTSSAGLTPVKMYLQLFDPWGNSVADTLMEIPDAASKKIW